MTFNLKNYLSKNASNSQTTEGQLNRKSKDQNILPEKQLEKNRNKTPEAVFEKQLEAVRSDNTIFYTTEGQLGERSNKAKQTTEAQLGVSRCECQTKLTERTLDKTRQSSFNSQIERTAKKEATDVKDSSVRLTEQRLEKSRTGEPNKLTEGLLDSSKSKLVQHRNPTTAQGAINKLDEKRKSCDKQTEYKAASETDKAMMLPEVKGDDGLRTAGKSVRFTKVASVPGENQFGNGLNSAAMSILSQYHIGPNDLFRYDTPNSEFPEIFAGIQKAKHGDLDALKSALQSRFGKPSMLSRVMGGSVNRKTAQYNYPMEPGIRDRPNSGFGEGLDDDEENFGDEEFVPDVGLDSDLIGEEEDEEKKYGDLIEKLTSGIEVPDDAELSELGLPNPELIDESKPNYGVKSDDSEEEYDEDNLSFEKDFSITSQQDINVGTTELRQLVLSFDINNIKDKYDAKQKAISFLYSEYPKLFSAKVNGKPFEISQSLNVNMFEGRITVTVPKSIF